MYIDKNLAIANGSLVSCAHNTSRASTITPWPWNMIHDLYRLIG